MTNQAESLMPPDKMPPDKLELEGGVSIARCSDGTIRIEIVDGASRGRIVEAIMSPNNFARAVTGTGLMKMHADCIVYPHSLVLLGSRREYKMVIVPLGDRIVYETWSDEDVAALLVPYEVDGWKGRREDVTNSHNINKAHGGGWQVRVAFFRYVDPETGELVTL